MTSSTLTPVINDGEPINWAELPPELTSSILHRLGAIEILENAQRVCRLWGRVSKDPSMWRIIDMHKVEGFGCKDYDYLRKMCRHAVDRSQGGLTEINISLLNYIAKRSSNLRSLKIVMGYTTSKDIMRAIVNFPLLEELEVSGCSLSGESLKVVGHSCPNLRTLKKNFVGSAWMRPELENDNVALAIAETISGLRHLELFGNNLTNVGLKAILDNCPNLQHLDLRQLFQPPACWGSGEAMF